MELETHGRWPLVGGVAVLPTTAAAARRPGLRPLAALLWHQTEEWVWPGAFLPWINREVLGSDEDEFPIDRRLGFIINVVLGWGLSLGSLAGPPLAGVTAGLYVSHLRADAAPVAITGLRRLAAERAVSSRAVRVGTAGGVIVSAGLIPTLNSANAGSARDERTVHSVRT